MTEKDWDDIRKMGVYTCTKVRIDGYDVSIYLKRSGMQLYYQVFLNGKIDFGMSEEIKRKFWFESKRRLYKKADWKGYSKARLKKIGIDPDIKVTYYKPYFASFFSLKAVLSKSKKIEVIEEEFDF